MVRSAGPVEQADFPFGPVARHSVRDRGPTDAELGDDMGLRDTVVWVAVDKAQSAGQARVR